MVSFFWGLISLALANNMLLPMLLMDDDNVDSSDKALLLMLAQNGQHGGTYGNQQMDLLLPLVLLSKSETESNSNTNLLLLTLMQQPNAVSEPNMLLPFLFMNKDDGDSTKTDMTTLFIVSSMMQRSCAVDTNTGLNNLMPLLLMQGTADNTDNNLQTLLLISTMSQGSNGNPIDVATLLPFILLMDGETDNSSNMLTMVLLSSSMGGMGNQQGYNNNFNMLLPLALSDCDSSDVSCAEDRRNMLVLLMAMQSSAPGSSMTSQQLLPLLLMKDGSSNQELIIFLSMLSQTPNCVVEEPVYITQTLPEPVVETVFREYKIDSNGKKTLIRESEEPFERLGN